MSQTEREVDVSIDALDDEFDTRDDATDAATNGDERHHDDQLHEQQVREFDDDEFELPEIVMATEDDDLDDIDEADGHAAVASARTGQLPIGDPLLQRTEELRVSEPARVPDDVLDELRRADIDGPVVPTAPQDDSSTIRRPRRSADHDPAPFPIPVSVPRMLGRKPRVRRVTRVVRHVDPWSVFKIALVANILLYITLLVAGVLLWNVAYATGTVDNVERFFESFGWSSFEFDGGEIYHNAWVGGLFVVIALTGFAVLMAALFNLITDLVGGVRFTVLEEEVVEARPSPMRRFVVRRAEPEVPAITYDASGPIVREAIVDQSGQIGVNAATDR
jgi:hypothetical protein